MADADVGGGKPILVAQGLGKHVAGPDGGLTILDGVDLTLNAGASLAIVGRSGSGKTTLLSLLAGLDVPSAGRVLLDGNDLSALGEEARAALRRRRVGFVFQSFQLIPTLDAYENVLIAAGWRASTMPSNAAARCWRRSAWAAACTTCRDSFPAASSSVALARAFVHAPALLFADEPTGNLDGESARIVTDLLFDLRRRAGTTLVLVTHDLDLAARCEQRLSLVEGRVAAGAPA